MPDTDTDQLSGKSPSTPPSSTSTREPASMDGWRSHDEIRADLATAEGRGSATRQSPTGRLVADVEPLLNEVERMADTLSDIFCEITGGRLSYPTYDARTIITEVTDTLDADIAKAVAEVEAERDRLRGVVQAVEALIEQARKVSPSPAMTVYVGDLEQALGLRVEPVRGIVGAES